jgi:hypothetical protein
MIISYHVPGLTEENYEISDRIYGIPVKNQSKHHPY